MREIKTNGNIYCIYISSQDLKFTYTFPVCFSVRRSLTLRILTPMMLQPGFLCSDMIVRPEMNTSGLNLL